MELSTLSPHGILHKMAINMVMHMFWNFIVLVNNIMIIDHPNCKTSLTCLRVKFSYESKVYTKYLLFYHNIFYDKYVMRGVNCHLRFLKYDLPSAIYWWKSRGLLLVVRLKSTPYTNIPQSPSYIKTRLKQRIFFFATSLR